MSRTDLSVSCLLRRWRDALPLLVVCLFTHSFGCTQREVAPVVQAPIAEVANIAPAVVIEALADTESSYLRIQEGDWDFWVQTPRADYVIGAFVVMGYGTELPSLTLPNGTHVTDAIAMAATDIAIVSEADAVLLARIPAPEGGLAVAEVFARRTELAGDPVLVRGRVVRASKGIFGKNWYHIVDGTGGEGTNDLTVTSQADLEVGQIVTFRGTLAIDQDLGFGYFYPALLELAEVDG